jgi:hypothetical protein
MPGNVGDVIDKRFKAIGKMFLAPEPLAGREPLEPFIDPCIDQIFLDFGSWTRGFVLKSRVGIESLLLWSWETTEGSGSMSQYSKIRSVEIMYDIISIVTYEFIFIVIIIIRIIIIKSLMQRVRVRVGNDMLANVKRSGGTVYDEGSLTLKIIVKLKCNLRSIFYNCNHIIISKKKS